MDTDHRALLQLEAYAEGILACVGMATNAPPSMDLLCAELVGAPPLRMPRAVLGADGAVARRGEEWRVYVADDVPTARARWTVGHELGHWFHRVHIPEQPETERRCDILGAMLCAPRGAVLRAVGYDGHAVTRLATRLRVPQSLALLRVGEATGRPVALVRRSPILRGEPHDWGDLTTMRKRSGAHPIRVDGGWGWMASAGA